MTNLPAICDGDLIGLSVTGGIAHFPGLATERTMALDALDPERVSALLVAADDASFFTRPKPPERPVRADARTWVLRLSHAGLSRLLTLSEPLSDPHLAKLVRLARGCFSAGRTIDGAALQERPDDQKEKPSLRPASILDALEMPGVEDAHIELDRSASPPRPATFG